ncbi:hypothetical protein [Asticcacaulis sp. YBE204]|uniref:hypothetical protein n=1 Tax=Asticcacaulis sp. YBE204 TaxID=1282363 RepID=UPI0003C3D927|nr:hypothetical protein [Asticcacaulis sp. YBE204]ESQ76996.1 hypothetical protein AEYBE204_18070 [Asticcacaulis sp. YBE204]
MTLYPDIEMRKSKSMWFDDEASDSLGRPVKMYSVVTPIEVINQYYSVSEPPLVVHPGERLLVLGAADGNKSFLWLEIDEKAHSFAMADICIAASKLRNVHEAGEGSA